MKLSVILKFSLRVIVMNVKKNAPNATVEEIF
ncbi:hypothetical protein DFQ07_2675 [Tenacibaculum caenipelagi]|uniref:Uncharacterized protein n=1 Tax=Tenacibaculum caenipelagi TaxID=1325435 RepID=A0A4R6TA58_9FLAO|nr:hypothetical protein DFQ07_2675 [Tenacibaculum caenipelagi]